LVSASKGPPWAVEGARPSAAKRAGRRARSGKRDKVSAAYQNWNAAGKLLADHTVTRHGQHAELTG
jgi:ribosomal protein L32